MYDMILTQPQNGNTTTNTQSDVVSLGLGKKIQKLEVQRKQLRWHVENSNLISALVNYIQSCDVNNCPFFNKTGPIAYPVGGGKCWSLYRMDYDPPGVFPKKDILRLTMFFNIRKKNDIVQETAIIDVPIDLVEDFDYNEFRSWTRVEEKIMRVRQFDKDLSTVKRLLNKHPKLFVSLKDMYDEHCKTHDPVG